MNGQKRRRSAKLPVMSNGVMAYAKHVKPSMPHQAQAHAYETCCRPQPLPPGTAEERASLYVCGTCFLTEHAWLWMPGHCSLRTLEPAFREMDVRAIVADWLQCATQGVFTCYWIARMAKTKQSMFACCWDITHREDHLEGSVGGGWDGVCKAATVVVRHVQKKHLQCTCG